MIRHIVAAAIGWTSAAHAATDEAWTWFTLTADGVRTGYAFEERRVEKNGIVERASTTVFVRQLGHRARIEYDATLHLDSTGRPLTFDYRQQAGTGSEEWHGVFDGGQLVIRQRDGLQWKESRFAVPDDAIVSPLWQTRIAAPQGRAVFDPKQKAFTIIAIEHADDALVRVRIGGDVARQIRLDAQGHILEAESLFLGKPITWTPCSKDCDARVAEPMDAIGSLIVRSPVRIPDGYRHRTIRYVLSRADGLAPDAVETAEQDVVRDGARAVVTVCQACGHESVPTPADIERFLKPNAWVRSDDAQIRHIARGATGGSNVHQSMISLTKFVALAMHGSNDFIGYADAVTALRTGSGDCTEFAVLLAALARARGIPARIAVGLAYSDRFSGRKDVFSPHMWVQAWDGQRWTSYDAALEGFDSMHIALGIGDGDPSSVSAQFAALPRLRIEKAGVVRDP
jgi:hypothetical protein